jgi:LuxR family transcriptional regulator, maltose regulon positive regulatory protein
MAWMTTLLPTKFHPPPVPVEYVARQQLIDKLDKALSHQLALVSAPAGAGKSTLVSAWVQSARKKGVTYGWLSLDEADNVPARFMEYLLGCLEEGGALLGQAVLRPESGWQASDNYGLTELIRELMKVQQEIIIILDDYHLIHTQEIHSTLGYLLEHMPPRLHMLILTRSDPPLELARMRVAGQLLEVRMEHLRFSWQEAASFLKKSAGVLLTEADVTALNTRTEGWIAGLQMAAISLRGRQDVSAFVAAFAGSNRFVFDYLLEQVLSRQTPEVRQFLFKTSVLEQLSAPLCDAVTETVGTARHLLDMLERGNLFLVPLDDERIWYRYHHLFADLLKLLLDQEQPGLAGELHRRASCWYEAQGMIPEAFQHALSANDMGLAARLVSENVLVLVEHAELAPILLRMEATQVGRSHRLSEDDTSSWLEVAYAWALAYTGQMERANTALRMAEQTLDNLPADGVNRVAGHIAAVRAYTAWVHGDQQDALDFAETATRLLPGDEIAVRALNLTTLGNALVQYNPSQRAVEVLEQATTLAQQAGRSHVYMLAASALAYALVLLGSLQKAHAICLEAIEVAEDYQRQYGRPLPAAASVYIMLANILEKWGQIQSSLQVARKGLALSELWGQADTIMLSLLGLADELSQAYEFEAAQQALQRARKLAQKISPWFILNVDAAEVNLWLDANDSQRAAQIARNVSTPLPIWLQARLLLQQNRLDEALSMLERALLERMESPTLGSVRLSVLQALAYYLKSDETQALSALRRALEGAEPENLVSVFVCEGQPMARLLQRAQVKGIAPKFTRQLLAAFQERVKPGMVLKDELYVEPLSERELEVLHRLNSHLSVPEIAGELYVSANTVRTHIKNIYGKLGVHRRSLAVLRGRELGLLE